MALSSLASLGMAPVVVWGRLVCLYLKFPDSEFDVRAGLLVGGLAGRLCTNAHGWQLPRESTGAGQSRAENDWLQNAQAGD